MSKFNYSKKKVVKGVIWSAIERFSVQGIQFVVSIILARLLTPSDFGIVAIVLFFSTIFQTVNESGFSTALVHKQNRDALDYSTAFITNLIIGIISYLFLYVSAPLIAHFYDNDALIGVMRILPLNLIIQALGLVPLASFTIDVDFKTQARASLTAAIVSGAVGIGCAYSFRNVYAIVVQQISYSVVDVSLMWHFSKCRFPVKFSISRFKKLFSYAGKLIGARVINVVFDDIYSLAIGKIYTPAVLGCYNRSMSFRQVLSKNIINIVQRVSVPLLCDSQHDLVRMKSVLLRFLSSTALIVFPLLAGLMVLSQPLIMVLLGEEWLMSAKLLVYGCPCGFFYLVSTFNRNIYNATGRTDLALKTELIKKSLFVVIFLFTMNYGIEILLLGLVLISFIEMCIDVSMAKKQIKISFIEEFMALRGVSLSTFAMAFVVFFANLFIDNNYRKLMIGLIVGVVIYTVLILIFNVADCREELENYGKAN